MRIANRINRFNGLANFLFYQAVIHEDDPFYLEPSLTRCTVASTAFSKIPLEKNSHNHDFEYIKTGALEDCFLMAENMTRPLFSI